MRHGSDQGTRAPLAGADRAATIRFGGLALILLGVVVVPLAVTLAGGRPIGVAGALLAYLGIAAIFLRALDRTYEHDRLGIANAITLLRTALIAPLVVPLIAPAAMIESAVHAWSVLALALASLGLDGVDGHFARRQKLVSAFGARFDVEIDSAFALILAVIALQLDKAGIWVLALGLPRYAFVLAGLALPWLTAPLPERFSRKLVCVIQIGVLIALLAPIIAPPASWVLAATASGLVIWSFGRDIVWLARARP